MEEPGGPQSTVLQRVDTTEWLHFQEWGLIAEGANDVIKVLESDPISGEIVPKFSWILEYPPGVWRTACFTRSISNIFK